MDDLINSLREVDQLARQYDIDNIFSPGAIQELIFAHTLGHTWNPDYKGVADGYGPNGELYEYKLCLKNNSWNFNQLTIKKINSFHELDGIFIGVRDGLIIDEIWQVDIPSLVEYLHDRKSRSTQKNDAMTVSFNRSYLNRNFIAERIK